ncbi:MAG: TldD/PmbA family protein, partial [Tannerella sp.]|nr:TldD/PmbA family protein [Tannerella sp.]
MRYNRREFIKAGGMAMIGSLAAPSLLSGCETKSESGASNDTIRFALNHFGVTTNDLQKVLSTALEKGGDYADLFFEHTFNNSIGLQDGAVNRTSSNIDFGVGIRVLSGDQSGYAYVENVSLPDMLKAAQTASRIAAIGRQKEPVNLTELPAVNNYYKVQTPWDREMVKDKMPFV